MTLLNDHQFEILADPDAADGFVFGIGAEVSLNEDGFDPGETDWLTQDAQNTRRGNSAQGRDVRVAKTWIWESHVNRTEVEEAVDTLERFADAWSPEEVMETPHAFTAVRYKLAGRTRRIFGRPRRFAAPPTNLILNGYVDVTHDFSLVDSFTYDDEESMAVMPYSSTVEGGGFTFPATFPIETTPSSGFGGGQLMVSGTARAYPIIRFNGPWLNPEIITDDWTLTWKGEIGPTGWVEIDTRPWVLTVLNQDGASVVGGPGASMGLSRRTWLEDCWFAPGSSPQITFGGSSSSGSATAVIRWRNTWKSI